MLSTIPSIIAAVKKTYVIFPTLITCHHISKLCALQQRFREPKQGRSQRCKETHRSHLSRLLCVTELTSASSSCPTFGGSALIMFVWGTALHLWPTAVLHIFLSVTVTPLWWPEDARLREALSIIRSPGNNYTSLLHWIRRILSLLPL